MLRNLVLSLLVLFVSNLCAVTVKLPVVADAGITNERGHRSDNSGASVTVPLRQNQKFDGFVSKSYLMRFDCERIQGMTISKAWLNIFLSRGDLFGIGLCTVLANWDEGRGINGQVGKGGASWNYARNPLGESKAENEHHWAWPDSKIYSISWAHPDARYQNIRLSDIEKREVDSDGILHLRFPVDPKLVACLSNGLAKGLLLTDDKGQITEALTMKGTGRPYRTSDNSRDIYIYTKEIQDPDLRPFMEVEVVRTDFSSPGGVKDLELSSTEPYDPSVTFSFTAPSDAGNPDSTILGYDVRFSKTEITESSWEDLEKIPSWAVPKPEKPGFRQKIRIFTPNPGTYFFGLRAVDKAGNLSPLSQVRATIPEIPETTISTGVTKRNQKVGKALVFEDKLELWACPDICKVDPVSRRDPA